VTLEIIKIIQF